MKKLFVTAALLAFPALAIAGNYPECLLEKLPGVQNVTARAAAVQLCQAKHGSIWEGRGSGRGLFATYDSSAECTLDKSRDTREQGAAQLIGAACRFLYNKPPRKPDLFDEFNIQPPPATR